MNNYPSKADIDATLILRHGQKLFEKLACSKVAICGLGGLGSNIAIALARAGVGHLHLIDFDIVTLSNIHRQQYFLNQIGTKKTEAMKNIIKEINPYIDVTFDSIKLDETNSLEILKEDTYICEAFDDAAYKAMLTNLILENYPDKYLVAASGMAGIGDANSIVTRKITDKFYLCGDGVTDIKDGMGLVASRVMICASHQAHKIVQIISEN